MPRSWLSSHQISRANFFFHHFWHIVYKCVFDQLHFVGKLGYVLSNMSQPVQHEQERLLRVAYFRDFRLEKPCLDALIEA